MRIYLGGPMRGLPLYNYQWFEDATVSLRRKGYTVRTPHEMDMDAGFVTAEFTYEILHHTDPLRPLWLGDDARRRFTRVDLTDDFTIEAALRLDVQAIVKCDAVAFLPGWRLSDGCQKEDSVRRWCGIPRYEVMVQHAPTHEYELIGA